MKKKLKLNLNSGTGAGVIFLICIVPVLMLCCCLCDEDPGERITIMSYNVQEFFDDVDNGTEFDEYDPGTGKWNTHLFKKRVDNILRVIRSSVPGGPDIIALQEVENMNTLGTLFHSGLRDMGYTCIVMAPEQGSAMNTGIISRIPVRYVRAYSLNMYEGRPLRKIIEGEFHYKGEVLYLFNNHWKSKRGSALETEESRKEAASILIARINELTARDPYADIVVCGDFNENVNEFNEIGEAYQTALVPSTRMDMIPYYDSSIFLALEPWEFQKVPIEFKEIPCEFHSPEIPLEKKPCLLFEPWYQYHEGEAGSYVFHQQWQTPDHILLSYGLFHEKGFVYKEQSFIVMNKPFLLDPLTSYPLTWDHARKKQGYSDHLPLLLTIILT
jgi:endonuclease/exonuclease/phosphatase family metal-dependent hydrolase